MRNYGNPANPTNTCDINENQENYKIQARIIAIMKNL